MKAMESNKRCKYIISDIICKVRVRHAQALNISGVMQPAAARCSVPHAEQKVYAVVRTACTLLQQTKDRQTAVACLQQLRGLLIGSNQARCITEQSTEDQDDLEKELASADSELCDLSLSQRQIACCLYWGPSAELLVDTLLSGACMLPCLHNSIGCAVTPNYASGFAPQL